MDTDDLHLTYDGPARYLDHLVERLEDDGASVTWERPDVPDWDRSGQTHVQTDLTVAGDPATVRHTVSRFREYCPTGHVGIAQPT